tara:strand:- start:50 stop:382 length:333 start_codon:yes stop_codon:yes gene_type:complete
MKKINFDNVKSILDNATWDYEFCGSAGSDVETACTYLSSQKFSIEKIQEFLPKIEDTDIEEDWEQEEVDEYIARFVSDELAWDRISKFLYVKHKKPNGWAVGEGVNFTIN